ncbi:hypothetical protein [Janthinobacterium sp.]|uniref:hypothetical protein n=1 Tax=Janthinobacterium sp. TaxID=1871054 RepID=UPI002DBD3310|nr:hypothetical protein [Janthinobacterium sp.]HEU4816154.1 hypothetical protein [Janthinobacterium sp.]
MGFEFRITASLAQDQRQHIAQLLEASAQRAPGAAMPNTDARLTDAGLYICQYLRPDPWHGLDAVRGYLDAQGVRYAVDEIDD